MKRIKAVILIALIALSTCLAEAQSNEADDWTTAGASETQIKPEEEREARELAVSFMKRLRETEDFGPLVSEFFANDFVERLRQLIRDENAQSEFFMRCEREAILGASEDDLRRVYLAVMNLWHQQELLGDAAWEYVKVKYRIEGKDALQEQRAWGQHLKLKEEAVPDEAFRIAQSHPLLDGLFNFIRQDREAENSEADEAEIETAAIQSVAQLRAFTDKVEQCIPLLRRGVEKLKADTLALVAAHGISKKSQADESNPAEEFRVYHFETETIKKETFGLPRGTILITARIYPYEMALARINSQLKILAVYPDFDGD